MYSTRNSFYLRISKNTVLPVYLYLDERHVNWMSDSTLQHVLSDLRPNILPKLKAEAEVSGPSTQRKATVDTHRGDTYQFCYFVRKTEPHSVLIKTRTFSLAPLRHRGRAAVLHNIPHNATGKGKQRKRKETGRDSSSIATRSKKRRIAKPDVQNVDDDDDDDDDDEMKHAGDENIDESDEEYIPQTEDANRSEEPESALDFEIVEEEKPKPILGLMYQGFNIHGQCLCIVVEPWPTARAMPFPLSLGSPRLNSQTTLETRKAIPNSAPKAPLFLPEEPDEIAESSGETRIRVDRAYLNRMLETTEVSEDEDEIGGMIEFSQVLRNIGDSRAGAINDDDDMDGSVLFGDADEFKDL